MKNIDNKKLATELAMSVEKSLNDFIEAEVCRRALITIKNDVGDWEKWYSY